MNMSKEALVALCQLWEDPDPEIQGAIEEEIRPLCEENHPNFVDWIEVLQAQKVPDWRRKLVQLTDAHLLLPAEKALQNWKDRGAVDLLEGWYWLSQTISGEKSLSAMRHQVNLLFTEVWVDLRPGLHPLDEIDRFNHTFFNKLAFQSNTHRYYAVSNSLLEDVIQTRTGNPISLCALYLLIGQRAGLPLYGVNLPNIFVLTYQSAQVQFYINVFNKGEIFTREQLEAYVQQIGLALEETYFEPCTALDMVRRMTRNLCVSFQKESDDTTFLYMEKILQRVSAAPK